MRILLADDQVLFVESLKTVLQALDADIEIVGVAYNGVDTVELVEKHRPDIVLMDVVMPELDGVEATRIIMKKYPETKIIMLTTFDEDKYVDNALHHGAVGYLLKDLEPNKLISMLRAVRNGAVQISPTVVAKLIGKVYHEEERPEKGSEGTSSIQSIVSQMSRRKREILSLLAKGFNNYEISQRLFLSEQTVANRISEIYHEIGVHNRIKLMQLLKEIKIDLPE